PRPHQQPPAAGGVEAQLVGAGPAVPRRLHPPEPALARIGRGGLPALLGDHPVVEHPVDDVKPVTPDESAGFAVARPDLDGIAVASARGVSPLRPSLLGPGTPPRIEHTSAYHSSATFIAARMDHVGNPGRP